MLVAASSSLKAGAGAGAGGSRRHRQTTLGWWLSCPDHLLRWGLRRGSPHWVRQGVGPSLSSSSSGEVRAVRSDS